jgi:hypothetical protein
MGRPNELEIGDHVGAGETPRDSRRDAGTTEDFSRPL